MKLQYFRGSRPNFGDELNTWLWPQLLPEFLDDDPSVVFIGIGSIIGAPYEATAKKVVFGTGYVPSYHSTVPNVHGGDWDIFCLRGPRTARALGLPEEIGIGDAAILIRALNIEVQRQPRVVGFMPHWESVQRGNWHTVCKLAGIRLIDPSGPVDHVIADILNCEVLLTESMHGAIVADALRVPWIPLLPIEHIHRDKWFDWADAMELQLRPHRLWPSNADEIMRNAVCWPRLSRVAQCLARQRVSRLSGPIITYAAAQRLSRLAKEQPLLSADAVLNRVLERMVEKLAQLERRYRKGVRCA